MNQHNITRQGNFIFIHFLANTEKKQIDKNTKKGRWGSEIINSFSLTNEAEGIIQRYW